MLASSTIVVYVETRRVMSVISMMHRGESVKNALDAQFVMLKLRERE